jgi:hypothetical protein
VKALLRRLTGPPPCCSDPRVERIPATVQYLGPSTRIVAAWYLRCSNCEEIFQDGSRRYIHSVIPWDREESA